MAGPTLKKRLCAAEIRKLYGPYWKANERAVSDDAIDLIIKLSAESIEGFEGADFITLTPILSEAISAARAEQREVDAQIAGNLNTYMKGFETIREAVKFEIAAAIRKGAVNDEQSRS